MSHRLVRPLPCGDRADGGCTSGLPTWVLAWVAVGGREYPTVGAGGPYMYAYRAKFIGNSSRTGEFLGNMYLRVVAPREDADGKGAAGSRLPSRIVSTQL